MISLHRIGHQAEEFHLNPDLIVTVEANPDTVITLTTGTKIVVAESPERVVEEVRSYRSAVLSGVLEFRRNAAPQQHGTAARRAAQGILVALESDENGPHAQHPSDPVD